MKNTLTFTKQQLEEFNYEYRKFNFIEWFQEYFNLDTFDKDEKLFYQILDKHKICDLDIDIVYFQVTNNMTDELYQCIQEVQNTIMEYVESL